MNIFNFVSLIGGLAFFLCGMEIMGDGLKKLSGSKLKDLLGKLTDSPLKAVALGTVVTAIIQSSSATTVMVVGFVNSGIIQLGQAVGVIMGANIGTTVTSWLISMTGIQGESLLLQFLKPSFFCPLLAFAGILLVMFSHSVQKNQVGYILLGFAILMTGMEMMSSAVEPLADVPEFTSIMTKFSNPILGMLAGTIITAVIQSSSASVGILQALCATGSVSFGVAIPIIMGQNIGTCITAIISSIGANRNAKRAALIHLFFNLIGTTVFVLLFYSIGLFVKYAFLTEAARPADIAVIHSGFNIAATIFLLPFNKQLVQLSYVALPVKEEEKEPEDAVLSLLDERFLTETSIAKNQAERALELIAGELIEHVETLIALFRQHELMGKQPPYSELFMMDERFSQINQYLVKIAADTTVEEDSKEVNVLLQKCGEMKGIAEQLRLIAERLEAVAEKKKVFSKSAEEELADLLDQVQMMLEEELPRAKEETPVLCKSAIEWRESLHKQVKGLKKDHMKRLRGGKCQGKAGICYMDVLSACEQIALHGIYMEEVEENN